jgi:DNA-binding CsgD family transcriptional regulator
MRANRPACGQRRAPALHMAARTGRNVLTPREVECLEWLGRGLDNEKIARKLGIATTTVALHLTNARTKLGAATREQALVVALQRALIDP